MIIFNYFTKVAVKTKGYLQENIRLKTWKSSKKNKKIRNSVENPQLTILSVSLEENRRVFRSVDQT